jgi:PKHD-type hydroxylase
VPAEPRPLLPPPAGPAWQPHQVFDAAFTPRQCDRLVACGDRLTTEGGALADDGDRDVDPALRRAQVAWLAPDGESAWVYDKLTKLALRANRVYGFDLSAFVEDLQYTVYDEPGAFYTWHQDGLDGEVATRKLSLVVQLSHPGDYEGADLEFLDVVEDYSPAERSRWLRASRARGTVIAFPAFEYHRVSPLVAGVRRSLVCWVGGPPFR